RGKGRGGEGKVGRGGGWAGQGGVPRGADPAVRREGHPLEQEGGGLEKTGPGARRCTSVRPPAPEHFSVVQCAGRIDRRWQGLVGGAIAQYKRDRLASADGELADRLEVLAS